DTTVDFIQGPALLSLKGQLPETGLTLILDANPTVGAVWELQDDTAPYTIKIINYTPYSELIGSSGKLTLSVNPNHTKSEDLVIIYHRAWKTGEPPQHKLSLSAATFPKTLDLSRRSASPIIKASGPSVSINSTILPQPSPQDLPVDYDLRNVGGRVYVTPARDQGFCGSCWAYAITAVVESRLLIDNPTFDPATFDLSEQYLISCNRSTFDCSGGNSTANDYLMDKYGQMYNPPGAVLESDFPESLYKDDYPSTNLGCPLSVLEHPYRLSNWGYVAQGIDPIPNMWRPYSDNPAVFEYNRDQIKSAILAYGAVGAGMWSGFDFGSYSGGIYTETTGTSTPNHDIVIVGWHDTGDPETSYWIIKNSNGPDWGYAGFAHIGFTSPVIGFGAYYVDIPDVYSGNLDKQLYLPLIDQNASGIPGHWVEVVSEDFERVDLGSNWEVNDGGAYASEPLTYSPYYWGISQCRATTTGGHSLWVVGDGAIAPPVCGSAYDSYGRLNAMATYGPVDLTNSTSAYMKFSLWLNMQPYGVWHKDTWNGWYEYDGFMYGAAPWSSFMSFPYYPGTAMGSTSGWKAMLLNLADMDGSHFEGANLLGRNDIYINFSAWSDGAEIGAYPEGIYVDDILIKKCIGGTCFLDW
ncbi:MAG: C1 family peptidase, partial [Anaerolineaceae bacterium]